MAGEALERMKPEDGKACVRVVCNSCLNPLDVQTARAAKWGMHREWCTSLPDEIGAPMKARLQRLYDFLQSGLLKVKVLPDEDPKLRQVERVLTTNDTVAGGWLSLGCIIFSQFYDSVLWLGRQLSARMPDEKIAVYAGAAKSGIIEKDEFRRLNRDEIKRRITTGDLRLVIGTEAASEGLNLQRLGSLINLDLPWNPTRLEQRKGRIQRIGQLRSEVLIYNMRYRGSVEDRLHRLLSERLANIRNMFGQILDTLEDVWVAAALQDEEEAKRVIDAVPKRHPFEMRYDRIENVDWESCSRVLDSASQLEALRKGW